VKPVYNLSCHVFFSWFVAIYFALGSIVAQGTTGCPNADFSLMNFTNWVGRTGSCCPINLPTTGISNGRHTIVTPGVDGQIAALSTVPPGKAQAARLGNAATGAQAEGLSYTFTVGPSNALFMYDFAVVLQDAGHTPTNQPRFELQVRNQFGNVIPCTNYLVVASPNAPGFQSSGNRRWRNWTKVGVDISGQNGNQVTIEARTGDCRLSGHFGYGYIYAECQPMQITIDFCVGDTVATMSAPSGFSNYAWRIQGQTPIISTQQTLTLNNIQPGLTYVCTVTSVMGCNADLTAVLNPVTPVPNFSTTNLCNGAIQFTDLSTVPNSTITTWQWSFGDGSTSTQQNPTHTFTQPGTYNVTLIPSSAAGCNDTIILPVVVPPIISPGFTTGPLCGLVQQFTNTSSISAPGMITGYQWNFGNGQTSTQQNPSVTFAQPGTYNVTLIVTDSNNCTKTLQQPVVVYAIPTAAFTSVATCQQINMPFTNTSTIQGNGALTYQWNFGSGQSVLQNPLHPFPQHGAMPVTLIVTGPGGCSDTLTQSVTVHPAPIPSFTLPGPCGLSQGIVNTSTVPAPGTITQNNWNFGNGQISNLQNPSTNYSAPGTYTVTLSVTTQQGCQASLSQPYTVYSFPVVSFTAPQTCHGNPTPFNSTSNVSGGGGLTNTWYFGNGASSTAQSPAYTYPQHGTYNATLVVSGPGNCVDSVTQVVVVPPTPVANFQLPPVCGLSGTLANTSTVASPGVITQYLWNLGNGQSVQTQNASYNYIGPGLYNVTLTVTTSNQCSSVITQPVQIYSVPNAQFTAPLTCYPLPVPFNNTSTIQNSSIVSWNWSFGDGSTSTQQNPTHVYPTHGTYTATLIATGQGGCQDTLSQTVNAPPTPVAQFVLPPSCGLTNLFTNTSTIAIPGTMVSHQWFFGDGNVSSQTSPTHSYTHPGTYNVGVIVTSDQGCIDTLIQSFTTYSIPNAIFNSPQTCFGLPLNITDNSTIQNSSIVQWQWNMGDGVQYNQQNPTHQYSTFGSYPITLVVTGDGGCTATHTQTVVIPPKPVAGFILPPSCGMFSPFVNSSSVATGSLVQYIWDFGDGSALSFQMNPSHTYSGNGLYPVRLEVVSDQGCRDTLELSYWKYHIPVAQFTVSNHCHKQSAFFQDLSSVISDQIVQWNWQLGDGSGNALSDFAHTYSQPGTYAIKLVVTSSSGCVDSATSNVVVYPLPQPSFSALPVCRGLPSLFLNNSVILSGQIVGYNWNFGSSVLPSQSVSPSPVIPLPGTYPVTLTATSQFGCVDSFTQDVVVWPRPDVDFSALPEIGCQPLLVQFSSLTSISSGYSLAQYSWDLGVGLSSLSSPSMVYTQAGQYGIGLVVTSDKGCDSSIYRANYITVHPKPFAEFTFTPPFPSLVRSEIFIEDMSMGANGWQYFISDGSSYSNPSVFHTFPPDSGYYSIMQVVTNQFGCKDTALKTVFLAPDYTIFIPNSFSPNGDGINEFFCVHGRGITEAKMWVFSRWGEQLAYLENLDPIHKGWNGRRGSELLKQDVYTYRIIVRDIFGEEHEYFGKVNLIK